MLDTLFVVADRIANKLLSSINELNYPTTWAVPRSSHGLHNVFRHFVPIFSRVAAPLNQKLQKDEPTKLLICFVTKKSAIEQLTAVLTNPPVCDLSQVEGRLVIYIDIGSTQLSCVILQSQQNKEMHPTGYCWRTLVKAETTSNETWNSVL